MFLAYYILLLSMNSCQMVIISFKFGINKQAKINMYNYINSFIVCNIT